MSTHNQPLLPLKTKTQTYSQEEGREGGKEEWKRAEKNNWLVGWLGGKKSNSTEWLDVQNRSLFLALTVSNVAVERVPDTHKIKIHGKGDLSFPESNVVSLTTLLFPSLAY